MRIDLIRRAAAGLCVALAASGAAAQAWPARPVKVLVPYGPGSGVDVVVRPARGTPIRLLSVHLKAGCSSGDRNDACPVLFQQVPVMERWIDARASEGTRFAVLGDFNRRLVMPADTVWAEWDDASPANADLARASGDQSARCNPRYKDFIDYIVLDRRAAAGLVAFDEKTYTADALSDHCAIAARLQAN